LDAPTLNRAIEIDEPRSPIKKALGAIMGIHQPNRRVQFLHRGRKVQERHVLDDLPDSDADIAAVLAGVALRGAAPAPVEQGGDERCDGFP
jgi:hypothetical protein